MGAVSSCCGGERDGADSQLDIRSGPDYGGAPPPTPEEIEDFRRRIREGVDVHLILQNKTKLNCKVRIEEGDENLLLSCDDKTRSIAFRDIKDVLHTAEQLKRVESSAGINDPSVCTAIHLKATGNCIPLFFGSSQDKILFVEIVREIKA